MKTSSDLEKCTDTCKNENDMPCINICGTKYMNETFQNYDHILEKYQFEWKWNFERFL